MKKGIGPYGSGVQLEQFQADFLMFEPKTKRETIVTQQAYQVRNVLVETRRGRLGTVNSGMPSSLWSLVILGGLITMTATLFFDTPSFRMHFWMTTLLSTLLGLMVFLVGTLDNPFRGNVSIGPASMQRVYDQLMVQHVFSEPSGTAKVCPVCPGLLLSLMAVLVCLVGILLRLFQANPKPGLSEYAIKNDCYYARLGDIEVENFDKGGGHKY